MVYSANDSETFVGRIGAPGRRFGPTKTTLKSQSAAKSPMKCAMVLSVFAWQSATKEEAPCDLTYNIILLLRRLF